jgi:hypothetical protein
MSRRNRLQPPCEAKEEGARVRSHDLEQRPLGVERMGDRAAEQFDGGQEVCLGVGERTEEVEQRSLGAAIGPDEV